MAMRRATLSFCLGLAACVWAASGAWADWAQRVAEAALVAERANGVAARVSALSNLVAEQEKAQSQLRADLRALSQAEAEARRALSGQEERTAALLSGLQRLGGAQVPAPLLHPGGVLAATRAGLIAGDVLATLAAEQAALVGKLQEVAAARKDLAEVGTSLETLGRDARAARQALLDAASSRAPLPPAYDGAPALAPDIEDLARLGGGGVPDRADGTWSMGALPLPVLGHFVPEGDGWRIMAQPEAMVRAPAAGTVLYAGPLRAYRLVILLELAPGHTLILAGLGQLMVREGASVVAGQGLGFLPEAVAPDTNVTPDPFRAGSLPQDALYMETRDANRPVDPKGWFMAEEDN